MNLLKLSKEIESREFGLYSIVTGEYITDRVKIKGISEPQGYCLDLIRAEDALHSFVSDHGFLLDQEGSMLMFSRDGNIVWFKVAKLAKRSKSKLNVLAEVVLAIALIGLVYSILFTVVARLL